MCKYFSAGSKFKDEFGIEYILVYLDYARYTLIRTNGHMSGFTNCDSMSTEESGGITIEDIRKMIGYHTFEVMVKI